MAKSNAPIPDNLLDLTRELVRLRQKPTIKSRVQAYPTLLQRFVALLQACDDVDILREVIAIDSNYYLLAGYRQQVLERWLTLERTPEVLRLYAMQLMLFGDVDDYGEADTDVTDRVDALNAEADALGK